MKLELEWVSYSAAKSWPVGCVVLVRIKSASPILHQYHYFISLYFKPSSPWQDAKAEYALIEKTK